jgi:hypothetical protein
MSLYGCEIWDINNPNIQIICNAWRKGIIRIRGIHCNMHNELMPLISCTLPMVDEICRHLINFNYKCLQSNSFVVRFVTYGVHFDQAFAPLGKNVFVLS